MIEKLGQIYLKVMNIGLNIFKLYESNSMCKFNKIFKCINGGAFKSKDYVQYSKNKLITIKNIDDNGFNINNVSFLNEQKIDKKYLLSIGDILLTMTGNIGRVGIVDRVDCYLNQRVLKILSPSKAYLLLFLSKYKKDIISLGRGTAQKNLSLLDLCNMDVYNSVDEITKFSKYDKVFDYLVYLKEKIAALQNIKSFLLRKYF